MPSLHAPSAPDAEGWLDAGGGHRVFWQTSGNPEGKPAIVLHGGPGSGSSAGTRRLFDPSAYRVVQLDQRGCGRSRPHASEPAIDLSTNTTDHLLRDVEQLRAHLGIERWLVYGGSWGCTLGLAYAERHPEHVTEMVLVAVTMTRRSEIEWLYRGAGAHRPEAFARFRAGAPPADRDGDLVVAYARLLHDPDPAVRARAAADFHDWEAALLSSDPGAPPPRAWSDPAYRLARARIVTHYFAHDAWLEEDALLRGVDRIASIPAVLVHGREDLAAPVETARELARAWPRAELVLVGGAGHSAGDPGIAEAAAAALDRFARA